MKPFLELAKRAVAALEAIALELQRIRAVTHPHVHTDPEAQNDHMAYNHQRG